MTREDENLKRRKYNPHYDSNSERRIAIIGAGFAGLTLANYIQKNGGDKWSCQVFESKEKPIPIVGTFRLPSWIGNILQQLEISIPLKEDDTLSEEIFISRQELLALLRKDVPIQFSCHVQDISKENVGNSYLKTSTSKRIGPFNLVIAANGLSFGEKDLSPKWKQDCDAIIGDCRWYQNLWWDLFGFTRIQRGGAIAIEDGFKLGQRLIAKQDLNVFAVSQQRTRRLWRKLLWVMLLFTVLSIILGSSRSSNNKLKYM